jgi:hypothetical protein
MYVRENVQKIVTPHHLKAFTKQSKNVKQIIPHGISKKDHHAGSTFLNEVSHISREEEYWLQYRIYHLVAMPSACLGCHQQDYPHWAYVS